MFNFMLKHKKGFTLVELMLVVVLMGFGVVALGNLFQFAFRTFNKSEERYLKQEAVKNVAEYLQHSINIGVATKAETYPTASVVPTVAGSDTSYAYIYVEKKDMDSDGVLDGYYLYLLERGMKKDDAVCLNAEIPLYINFSVYQDYDFYGDTDRRNQCGVKVDIAAVDADFQYKTAEEYAEEGITEEEAIADYIFFNSVVSYHFPNMLDTTERMRVNYTGTDRDEANEYDENGATGNVVESEDVNCKVLRITTDTTLSVDGVNQAISVSSFCFIATAGFGEATGEVGILCDFRDNVLMTNPLGRMLVKAYYTVSPPIADFIRQSEPLKAAVRVMLKPLVVFAVYALEPTLLLDVMPYLIMGILSFAGIVAVVVVAHRRKKLNN